MDLNRAVWRKASRSASNGGACVEVAAVWRKASRSEDNGGHCVELSRRAGAIAVRDSKDPSGPVLVFAPEAWREFTAALKRH